jgi:hypothetical protein
MQNNKNHPNPIGLLRALSLGLLCLVVCVQIYLTVNNYMRLWRMPIWRLRTETSYSRSAVYYLKAHGAGFLKFIQENIPPDGKIIIPKSGPFSEQSIMQFYLLDRDIFSCPNSTQLDCLSEPDKYLIATTNYPPQIEYPLKTFLPYPGRSDSLQYEGLFIPNDQAGGIFSAFYPENFNPVATLAVDACILLIWGLAGWLILSVLINNPAHPMVLIGAFPFGMGLFTWLLFIVCLVGAPLTVWTLLWTYLGILLVALLLARKQLRKLTSLKFVSQKTISLSKKMHLSPLTLGLIAVLIFMAVSLIYISVGRGYSSFDDMAIWSLKGYYMAFKHDLFAAGDASGHGLSYPLNLSLAIASYYLIDQDLLPGSKLVYLTLFFSMLVSIYWFLRKQAVPQSIILVAILLLFSTPVLYKYASLGFANIPFTCYLVIGTLAGLQAAVDRQIPSLFSSGLILSLAGWTRPEGIGFVFCLAILIAWVGLRNKMRISLMVVYLLLSLWFCGTWILIGNQYFQEDEIGLAIRATLGALSSGTFSWASVWATIRYSIDQFATFNTWGVIVPVSAIILVSYFPLVLRGKKTIPLSILSAGLIMFLIPLGMFITKYHQDPANYLEFLSVSFDRAQFPAIVFLIVALPLFIACLFSTNTYDYPGYSKLK